MSHIKESDWQLLCRLLPVARERFSERVLGDVQRIGSAPRESAFQKCWGIFNLATDRRQLMAEIFDNLDQSKALMCAVTWRSHGLLMDDEMAQFSQELQDYIVYVLSRRAIK